MPSAPPSVPSPLHTASPYPALLPALLLSVSFSLSLKHLGTID